MKLKEPKVSIIIPVHNNEDTIVETINSCVNQNYKEIEILVVINGSNDASESLVREIKDKRVTIYCLKYSGRSLARNFGLKTAKGKYIQFLDSDDRLEKSKIKNAVHFLENNPESFGYFSSVEYIGRDGKKIKTVNVKQNKQRLIQFFNLYPINSLIFRNNNITLFEDSMEFNEDWLFWVENVLNRRIYCNNNQIGGYVNITGNNTMTQLDKMIESQLYVRIMIIDKYKFDYRYFLRAIVYDSRLLREYYYFKKSFKQVKGRSKYIDVLISLLMLGFKIPTIRARSLKRINDKFNSNIYTEK